MHTNIQQVLVDLSISQKPITVANAFPVYMRIAGFSTLCDDAVASFERAMDKHPAFWGSTDDVQNLRKEYWLDKQGYNTWGDHICDDRICDCAVACACPACGASLHPHNSGELNHSGPVPKRSKKAKKATRTKQQPSSPAPPVRREAPPTRTCDPNSSSTSAIEL